MSDIPVSDGGYSKYKVRLQTVQERLKALEGEFAKEGTRHLHWLCNLPAGSITELERVLQIFAMKLEESGEYLRETGSPLPGMDKFVFDYKTVIEAYFNAIEGTIATLWARINHVKLEESRKTNER